jgi:L-asparaginase II
MDDSQIQGFPEYSPIYHLLREDIVESVHYGAIAVVDSAGNLIAWHGNPTTSTYLRSSAKPLQAISLIEMGGVEKYQMTGEEIAILCASHSSTDLHLKTIYGLQRKIGISESDLRCCTHQPFDPATKEKLRDQGLNPNQNHHNCSGKHTGMLALAKIMDVSLKDYTEVEHPIQKQIKSVVADMCKLKNSQIQDGRDGCSVPTFAMPLKNAALGWARLADPAGLSETRRNACRVITRAMLQNPYHVAGPGRLDTRLTKTSGGNLICKGGAEAFQAIGIIPDPEKSDSTGYGIAIKIADGDQGKRVRSAVVLEVLRQLNVLDSDQLSNLKDMGPNLPTTNQCQVLVGERKPCFQLQYS